jgi:repressor LexA
MGRTPTGQTRARVLVYVRQLLLDGSPPSVREVQRAMGFRSVGTARQHLEALVREGHLSRTADGQHRGLRLAESRLSKSPSGRGARQPARIPILGRVQAGSLTQAIQEQQDTDDHVVVTTRHPPGELFALRVRGDSMTPELLPDDIVVVRRQPRAEPGELVVAMVDDEATIKRLRVLGSGADVRFELHASNPNYAPIAPDPAALTILGKVVELRRHYDPRHRETTHG